MPKESIDYNRHKYGLKRVTTMKNKKVFFVSLVLFIFFVSFQGLYAAAIGDVNSNGSIDIVDALLVAQYYVGLNPSGFSAQYADVNSSGSIDIVDALLVAQYYVGLITEFPGTGTPVPTTAPTAVPTQAPQPTPVSGALPVEPFSLSQVSLASSPFTENRDRTLSYLRFLDSERMLHMFRVTAGLSSSAQAMGGWEAPDCLLRGHSMGHYLVALSQAYASSQDSQYKTRVTYLVTELGKCQDALYTNKGCAYGFLSAYNEDQFKLLETYTTYPTIWAPYYTFHKIMAGLLAAYNLTGNTQALDIAKKMGSWVYNRLSRCTKDQLTRMWAIYIAGEYGGMNEVLAELYSITGDSTYMTAAGFFDNDAFFTALSNNQDQLSGRHANQHIPQTIGALRIYDQNKNSFYYNVANNFWRMVTGHHMYVIGGTSEGEMFRDADKIAAYITKDTCETCCAYNMLKLTRRLFFHDPRPELMDYYERALYNQVLASQNPASSHGFVTYMIPLNPGGSKVYTNDYDEFTCCHGTGMESHTKYQETVYARSSDNSTLYVNLYIPSTLAWTEKGLTITQSTNYPTAENTVITVTGSGSFTLKLRVPYWVQKGFTVRVNGTTQSIAATPGTFASITRSWQSGDQVTIDMPFSLRVERTPDNYNRAAIMYGPIVLAGNSTSTSYISLTLNSDPSQSIQSTGTPLYFTVNGLSLLPFYKAHNMQYHVYFTVN